ncbi:MAG: SMP-30/gluconolactonase/LRE family protein [Gammaproteobacteria bacterium]
MRKTAFLAVGIACLVAVAPAAQKQKRVMGPSQLFSIERSDAALAAIIDPHVKIESLGGPFGLTEGSTWVPEDSSGYLVVSDLTANAIYRVEGNGAKSVLLDTSGATVLDLQGRLIWVAANDGTLMRMEKDGTRKVLAAGFNGKRFDPANDVAVRSDGTVFLIEGRADSRRDAISLAAETPHGALYAVMGAGDEVVAEDPKGKKSRRSLRDRKVSAAGNNAKDGGAESTEQKNGTGGEGNQGMEQKSGRGGERRDGKDGKGGKSSVAGEVRQLLTAEELGGYPTGIALSPDEKVLYVGTGGKKVNRYEVHDDGTLGPAALFAEDAMGGFAAGMKTDRAGNLYSTNGSAGPGIVRVTSPAGKLLGRLHLPVFGAQPKRHICATHVTFGNLDGKTLFVTACEAVYKVRLKSAGPVPGIVIRH